MTWQPPRCSHGFIILGCPYDDCLAQNEYLEEQDQTLRRYQEHKREEARRIVRELLDLPR